MARCSFWVVAYAAAVLIPFADAADRDAKKVAKKSVRAASVTVPVFALSGMPTEAPAEEFPLFGPMDATFSLRDLTTRLRKAADDAEVKVVVLMLSNAAFSVAQTEEIRQAMAAVRGAGKEIWVHADTLSTTDYSLAVGASRLSMSPTSDLWLTGAYASQMYVSGLLKRLGVKADFLTCGDYKSAAEMLTRDGPSPEADKMQNWLLDSQFGTRVKLIADGRKVKLAEAKTWIDDGPYSAEGAKKAGLIDAVEHRQEFEKQLRAKFGENLTFDRRYGRKKPPKIDFSSPFAAFSLWADMLAEAQQPKSTKPAVGIVYVDGPIMLGGGGQPSPFETGGAFSGAIRKALDEAARRDDIKAVVLRVDSPGGSAVASEIIMDATLRVRAKKPFLVSMGSVAASGGYYVACGSDTIFADAGTITGSIGVVGGKLATKAMWEKIGVTFKDYQRGAMAGLLGSSEPFTAKEREKFQGWMDEIYGVFKGHVVRARGDRLKKPIDELAGGRVYTGEQALEFGLVDKLGTLHDAIAAVAEKAKLAKYDVKVVPEPKNFIELLLEESDNARGESPNLDGSSARLRLAGGNRASDKTVSLVELAEPMLRALDGPRVGEVRRLLATLQWLHQERVLMLMPEWHRN